MALTLLFRAKTSAQVSILWDRVSNTQSKEDFDTGDVGPVGDTQTESDTTQMSNKSLYESGGASSLSIEAQQRTFPEDDFENDTIAKHFSSELLAALTRSEPLDLKAKLSKQEIRGRINHMNDQIKLMRDNLGRLGPIEVMLPSRCLSLLGSIPLHPDHEDIGELEKARRVLVGWIDAIEREWELIARCLFSKQRTD